MNIRELIQSTNKVKNRGDSSVFKKKFGSIYAYNKNVTIARGGSAIIVNMVIGGVTDFIKSGGKRVPVAYHRVALAINKVNKHEYTPEQLVDVIRTKYKEYSDEDEWKAPDILKNVLENPNKFFPGYTVFPTTNSKGYVVVENRISDDSEIQVWCSCSDYYWTFQYYNMQDKGKSGASTNLYGDRGYPTSYVYKSERGKKASAPLRNPGRNPGMCKHLMLLLAMLIKENVIQDKEGKLIKSYSVEYNKFLKNKEKERVSSTEYENMISSYSKDQSILNKQRRLTRISPDEKGSNFDAEKGTHSWNKMFKASSGKNVQFNPKNGKFGWENKSRKRGEK